jgi:hypothetical protein
LSPRNIRLAEVESTCWAPGLFWLRVPGEVERPEGLANLSKNLGDSIEAATLNSTASQHRTPSKLGTQMPQIEAVRKRASFINGNGRGVLPDLHVFQCARSGHGDQRAAGHIGGRALEHLF